MHTKASLSPSQNGDKKLVCHGNAERATAARFAQWSSQRKARDAANQKILEMLGRPIEIYTDQLSAMKG